MGWLVIVIIAYLPIIYRIHRRLDFLEKEVERLSQDHDSRRTE
ncbi:hypothetical protein [Bacillus sp. ISL-35]|nr:hypothetical protein [Bacillus sp. ISL-35]